MWKIKALVEIEFDYWLELEIKANIMTWEEQFWSCWHLDFALPFYMLA